MAKRRQFIREVGLGAISSLALASAVTKATPAVEGPDPGTGKKIRIGIIGAENSHSYNIGKVFNIDKKYN